MKLRIPFVISAMLSVAACGRAGELTPQQGKALPQAAYGQEERQSSADLIQPTPQARPERSAQLLRRSTRRETDPFDLPPGGDPNAPYKASPRAPDAKDTPSASGGSSEPASN